MKEAWVVADSIVSPLGTTGEENFENLKKGVSGVKPVHLTALSATPIAVAALAGQEEQKTLTRFESICLQAIRSITERFHLPPDRTLFLLSSTKGNIRLLESGKADHTRIHLHATAAFLAEQAGIKQSMVVSNACISGVMALTVAKRFLQGNKFDHALVVGADELSRFVVSGFQSLSALSDDRCRPFDANRRGINLGEAAAVMLISTKPEALGASKQFKILGSGLSNDANHISGPSRTGEELSLAVKQALTESEVATEDIDFISAHGTATLYNDEMEAKAFNLAGLAATPLNSLKGYYGHTLGAAGLVETIVSLHALKNNTLIPTLGYETSGVSQPVNVIRKIESKPLKIFLKTASGFGGCNAAIVIQAVE